jgi:hypothetical protein
MKENYVEIPTSRPVTRVTRPVPESRRNSLGYWESCQILTGPFDGDSRRTTDIHMHLNSIPGISILNSNDSSPRQMIYIAGKIQQLLRSRKICRALEVSWNNFQQVLTAERPGMVVQLNT